MNAVSKDSATTWAIGIEQYPTAVAFSSDGRWLAVGDADGRIAVLNVIDGKLLERWAAHEQGVQSLHWHPSKPVLLSGAQDGRVCLWTVSDVAAEFVVSCVDVWQSKIWVDRVAFNPQGTRLVATAGKTIVFADDKGDVWVSATEHASSITGVAWRNDGEQVVTSCYGGIQTVAANTALIKNRFKWTGSMISLSLSPDGRVAACGCQDNSIHFWRLRERTDSMMSGYPSKPNLLSWRVDSALLASSGGAEVTLWSFANNGPEGTEPILLQSHQNLVTALAFAPRGAGLVSGCRDGQLAFWLPGKSSQPLFMQQMSAAIAQVVYSLQGDEMRIAVADVSGRIDCLSL
jgi:WD40 repeat protein